MNREINLFLSNLNVVSTSLKRESINLIRPYNYQSLFGGIVNFCEGDNSRKGYSDILTHKFMTFAPKVGI